MKKKEKQTQKVTIEGKLINIQLSLKTLFYCLSSTNITKY